MCMCEASTSAAHLDNREVGDARFLEWRKGWAHDRPVALGFLLRLSVSWSLGCAVLGARSSWGSHAHPLASCFVSLALLVSRISSVYLSKWHSSWRV